jgi:YidC/Oxa1 family membrane protein insertase
MDRRTFIFIALSVLIVIAYQELVLKRIVPPPAPRPLLSAGPAGTPGAPERPEVKAPATDVEAGASAATAKDAAAAQDVLEGRRIVVDTDLYTATVSTIGGRLQSLTLKRYRTSIQPDSPPLELVIPGPDAEYPMGVELRGKRSWSDSKTIYQSSASDVRLTGAESATVELRASIGDAPLIKRLSFRGDSYPIELEVEVPAGAALPAELTSPGTEGQSSGIALTWTKGLVPHTTGARVFEGAAALIDGKLVQNDLKTLASAPKNIDGTITWAGYEDQYFLSAVAPAALATELELRPRDAAIETKIVTLRSATGPGPLSYTLFVGPKELPLLDAADHGFARAVNLGWFGAISLLLLRVLTISHHVTHNYGIDIIFLTVLVKIVFWPLTQRSFKSMREMQKLQPQMTKIREKFKDDSKKMNEEIMELYRRHKVNPLGGCLPMLLQIPVFFGLYQALANAIELRHAPFVFWVHDLSAPERLMVMGYGIPVLTILLGASMFLQQRMTPPAGDPTQQKIMMFMPLIFTYMFIGFPAGLTIYWLTNNLLTMAQQYFVIRGPTT